MGRILVDGEPGNDLVPELAARPGEAVIVKPGKGAFYATPLDDILKRDGVGHLHCHFAHAPATVGMYAARQLGVPFSFVGHANDLFQRRRLLRTKLRRAAFVSCISEWHRALYRSANRRPVSPGRGAARRNSSMRNFSGRWLARRSIC